MNASRAIGPSKALEIFAGLLVREIHDLLAFLRLSCNSLVHTPILRQVVCFVKCIIPVSHLSEASRLKTDLSAKVQATAEELERVKAVQASRTPLLDKIPLMDQKLDEVRDQSKENGRDLKDISGRLARMEGAMKAQSLARP